MVRVGIAALAGIGFVIGWPNPWVAAGAVLCLVAALATTHGLAPRVAVIGASVSGVALAVVAATSATAGRLECSRDREKVLVNGEVATTPFRRGRRLDFDVIAVLRAGEPERRLRVTWYEPTAVPLPGERWELPLTLRCPRGFVNGAGADRERTLLLDRVHATAYTSGAAPRRVAPAGRRQPVERWRSAIGSAIAAHVDDSPSVGVLQGLAVGLRGDIPEAQWRALAATGLTHLIAISGLHVTAFALGLAACCSLLWRAPVPDAWRRRRIAADVWLVLAVTLAYALLAGASVPTLRTVGMLAIALFARLARRGPSSAVVLVGAAVWLVALDPLAPLGAGFWLSFLAVAALLLAAGPDGPQWRALVRAQDTVTAALVPVSLGAFGGVPIVSPVANLVAIPVFTVLILPASLLGLALLWPAPELAGTLWRALARALDAAWPVLEAIASHPAALWRPAASSLPVVLLASVLVGVALAVPLPACRAAAGAALLMLIGARAERPPHEGAWLTVLDVGQGLAAVVETRSRTLVFDTGPAWRDGGAAADSTLLPWLASRGARRVDLLVISHADIDHAGGAPAVLRRYPTVPQLNGEPLPASDGTPCVAGQRWRWDGVSFEVVHPATANVGGNEGSCVLRVTTRWGVALLTADIGADTEESLDPAALAADVVLVPHHGSAGSSSASLVAGSGARLALVSAGYGNRWRHPRPEVVARWQAQGAMVACTAQGGALQVRFDGRRPLGVLAARAADRAWWRVRRNAAEGGCGTV